MTQGIVNGHTLPRLLVCMTSSQNWCSSRRAADLSSIPIEDKDDLIFLDVPEMIRNTLELRSAFARGDAELFSLTDGGTPIPGFLDVTQAVVIAATYGQEALALDYSVGEQPRVVATQYEPGRMRWIEVAPSFEELLKILKLSGATGDKPA